MSRLRRDIAERLDAPSDAVALAAAASARSTRVGAQQIVDYVAAERAALGVVPSDTDIVFERFFDDAGGMQLVVHAPFGGRVNRGFGLALRKRFCVNFDFELQAAATDDAVVLSMGPQHSFPLEDAFSFVRANNVRDVAGAGDPVRADVGRALALERDARRCRCCAATPASRCRRRSSACAPTICWPRCSRSRSAARRTSPARSRSPTTR